MKRGQLYVPARRPAPLDTLASYSHFDVTTGAIMDHVMATRQAYERINAGDIAGFGDLLADDFVEHETGTGFPPTKAGTLDYFRVMQSAFPDMRMTVDDLIATDDKAVARVTVTGTQTGEFMGVPPTGKHVEMQVIDIMEFDDVGLLHEHWGVADALSLMQQLGAVPAPPSA